MSVTKTGADDARLRLHEQRRRSTRRSAACRRRDHGRRRGRQRQPQRRAQRPGELQRGHHRLRPGRHRRAARRRSAATAATRGAATTATTRSPTSATTASDVDIIAPGKCIWSTMPGPTLRLLVRARRWPRRRHRRRRPVQGQPPERDAGRGPRGAALPRQPQTGRPRPTRTRTTSRCSTCRASGPSAPSRCRRGRTDHPVVGRHGASCPITVTRSVDLLRARALHGRQRARRAGRAVMATTEPVRLDRERGASRPDHGPSECLAGHAITCSVTGAN